MKKPTILIVCTTGRDRRETAGDYFRENYTIHFQDYDDSVMDKIISCAIIPSKPLDPQQTLNELLQLCDQYQVDGVASSDDYPGSIFASVIAQKRGLPGASPQSILTCQHKYYCRLMAKKFVPEATPDFRLINPKKFNHAEFDLPLPVFVKPVKSYFSILANAIHTHDGLSRLTTSHLPHELFLSQLNWFLKNYSSYDLSADYLLAESLLSGVQVTVEGFVYHNDVTVFGVVDSIMFPGTRSFERFEYPSSLSEDVQKRMATIAERFIKGIGMNNSLFNIEMMYNSEQDLVHIIEVNPRMSNQFADLYEKVDGFNTYQILLDLASGKKPQLSKRAGNHKIAASFVLRDFEDKSVKRIPSPVQIEMLQEKHPELRVEIHTEIGQQLSDILQDGKSYRYGLIHLGGSNHKELYAKYEACKALLSFEFT